MSKYKYVKGKLDSIYIEEILKQNGAKNVYIPNPQLDTYYYFDKTGIVKEVKDTNPLCNEIIANGTDLEEDIDFEFSVGTIVLVNNGTENPTLAKITERYIDDSGDCQYKVSSDEKSYNEYDILPYLKPFDKVIVSNGDGQLWKADFFSHYEINDTDFSFSRFTCVGGEEYIFCLPYEGNADLLGYPCFYE